MKLLVTGMFALASIASGATLTVNMNVDNVFDLYLSTSDAVLGTAVGTGNNWPVTYTFTPLLTPGVTNYIHIVAVDQGLPAGFLGDFSVDDPLFQFVNGTQSLVTNTTWSFNTTGFGNPYSTPADEGANGVGPWGTRTGVSGGAHWIWDPRNASTVYFSTPITYTGASTDTPEPAAVSLLVGGLALCLMRRRKSSV